MCSMLRRLVRCGFRRGKLPQLRCGSLRAVVGLLYVPQLHAGRVLSVRGELVHQLLRRDILTQRCGDNDLVRLHRLCSWLLLSVYRCHRVNCMHKLSERHVRVPGKHLGVHWMRSRPVLDYHRRIVVGHLCQLRRGYLLDVDGRRGVDLMCGVRARDVLGVHRGLGVKRLRQLPRGQLRRERGHCVRLVRRGLVCRRKRELFVHLMRCGVLLRLCLGLFCVRGLPRWHLWHHVWPDCLQRVHIRHVLRCFWCGHIRRVRNLHRRIFFYFHWCHNVCGVQRRVLRVISGRVQLCAVHRGRDLGFGGNHVLAMRCWHVLCIVFPFLFAVL